MAKRCTRCCQWKEASDFYRDKSKLDGLKSHCKDCHESYKRSYRSTPAARLIEKRRIFWRRWLANPSARRAPDHVALLQAWRARNIARRKAHVMAHLRQWHARHKDETRQWQRDNKEPIRAGRQAVRARQVGATINDLSSVEWQWLLDRYGRQCAYCGSHGEGLTPDHVIPLSRGGDNTLSNIVPACGHCNLKKGARTPDEAGLSFAVRLSVIGGFEQLALI